MVYEYDDIVIGSSLDAVVYAFNRRYPLFYADIQRPFRFDFLSKEFDLSFLKIPILENKINTFEGVRTLGVSKELLWERLLFLMSLDGLAPVANLCSNIRHADNKITCFNQYSKIAEVRYNNLHDFTDKNLSKKVICHDWIAFNSGGKHDIDFIETKDDFVNNIWFYPSDRICGKTKVKDACAISIIDSDQLDNFDFSETMARFKVVKEMETRGMKGLLSSYDANGRPKHYKFKTSTMSREKNAYNFNLSDRELKSLNTSSFFYRKYLRHL